MPGKIFTVRATESKTFDVDGIFTFVDGTPACFEIRGEKIDFDQVIQDSAEPRRFRCRFGEETITLSEHQHGDQGQAFVFGEQQLDDRGTAVWVAEEGGTIGDE